MAFLQLEPLPDAYWIGGQICAVLANVNSAKGRQYKAEDFIPRAIPAGGANRRKQSTEEMMRAFKSSTDRAR